MFLRLFPTSAASAHASLSSSSSTTHVAHVGEQPQPLDAPALLGSRERSRDDSAEADDVNEGASEAKHAAAGRVYLHRHALESIFAFLDIAGLATALAVSRDWQAAVGSMRSIDHSMRVIPDTFQQLLSSRLRRHVASLLFETRGCPLTPHTVSLLHFRMPHLLRLQGQQLNLAYADHSWSVASLPWPSQLQKLVLTMHAETETTNVLLRSFGGLLQLRELDLNLFFTQSVSLAPLAALSLLRHFKVRWLHSEPLLLSDAQVDQLRMLVTLDTLDMPISIVDMLRLLRPPHFLRWRTAPWPNALTWDDAACALLPSLSCLTQLTCHATCTHFDRLPRMQRLSTLVVGLTPSHPSPATAAQSLVSALQGCRGITALALECRYWSISPEQLAACLTGMPALSTLQLWFTCLPSLAFLSVPTLAQSLRELVLHHLRKPKPALSELQHLHGLRSLRRLTLHTALAAPLDEQSRTTFTPPSAVLPLLELFDAEHAAD